MFKKLLLLVFVGSMISAGGDGAIKKAVKMTKKSNLVSGSLASKGDDCGTRCVKGITEEPYLRVLVGVPLFCSSLVVGIIQYNLGMLENKPEWFKNKSQ